MSSTTLFTNNRSQAVRLPADARFPQTVRKVDIRVIGHERVITPVAHAWDSFFAASPHVPLPSDDYMAERSGQEQAAREDL